MFQPVFQPQLEEDSSERKHLPFAHDKFEEENWKLITVISLLFQAM